MAKQAQVFSEPAALSMCTASIASHALNPLSDVALWICADHAPAPLFRQSKGLRTMRLEPIAALRRQGRRCADASRRVLFRLREKAQPAAFVPVTHAGRRRPSTEPCQGAEVTTLDPPHMSAHFRSPRVCPTLWSKARSAFDQDDGGPRRRSIEWRNHRERAASSSSPPPHIAWGRFKEPGKRRPDPPDQEILNLSATVRVGAFGMIVAGIGPRTPIRERPSCARRAATKSRAPELCG